MKQAGSIKNFKMLKYVMKYSGVIKSMGMVRRGLLWIFHLVSGFRCENSSSEGHYSCLAGETPLGRNSREEVHARSKQEQWPKREKYHVIANDLFWQNGKLFKLENQKCSTIWLLRALKKLAIPEWCEDRMTCSRLAPGVRIPIRNQALLWTQQCEAEQKQSSVMSLDGSV